MHMNDESQFVRPLKIKAKCKEKQFIELNSKYLINFAVGWLGKIEEQSYCRH